VAGNSDKNVVNSLAKGFRVLGAFTSEEPELVLAELARRANLDNATTFRLLNTLVMLGYVQKVGDSRKFRLTLKCLDLGFNAIGRSDLRTQARPILRGLVGEVNEAASIGVLEGTEVVYIERMQAGMTRLGVDVRIGSRVPVHSTAIGHAIVGFLPRAEQERILAAAPRKKMTERTITDVKALLKRLKQVRERGYAIADQENVTGLCVLAAPILDTDGFPVAGLSVAAPAFRMSAQAFEKAGAVPLLNAAQQLSRGLNATGGFALHSTHQ
jgi:IclR family pca regulon transcriptional regulator